MRKLATIERIEEIQPIPNADAIEKVRVRDWWCVTKKGEFVVNDPCVYFEIDSLLPSSNPVFSFLGNASREVTIPLDNGETATGYRLKTVKLRGQISQGLALPCGLLDVGFAAVGDDVTELLRVHLWERPLAKGTMGFARGPFPSFIPKTDEERVQNMREVISARVGTRCYITEKLDGTSLTCFWQDGEFHVCSRNLDLKEGDNLYWQAAAPYKHLIHGLAMQGEVVGEGIQGNPLMLKGRKLYLFSVYNFESEEYMGFDDFRDFAKAVGIDTVPIIDHDFVLTDDVAGLIAMADGKSKLNLSRDREGLVVRSHDQGADRLSFKCISNKYLLKEK